MELFLDTCDVNAIKEAVEKTGQISGVTTNPSLMRKAGRTDYRPTLKEICAIDGINHVSAQVTEDKNPDEMAKEGIELWNICPQKIVIKVPSTSDGLRAIDRLRRKNVSIPTNVTLIFSSNQALMAMQAYATYISPFIGRLQEMVENQLIASARKSHSAEIQLTRKEIAKREARALVARVLEDIMKMKWATGSVSNILAASIREIEQVIVAAKLGVDVISMPPNIFWELFNDRLSMTKAGLAKFLEDRKLLQS